MSRGFGAMLVMISMLAVGACSDEPDILHESACRRLDVYGRAVEGTFFSGPVEPNTAANALTIVQQDELSPEISASRFGDELADYRESVWHALDATRAGGGWDQPGELLRSGQSLWADWDCSRVDGPSQWATATVEDGSPG